jgi:hypothetical protein
MAFDARLHIPHGLHRLRLPTQNTRQNRAHENTTELGPKKLRYANNRVHPLSTGGFSWPPGVVELQSSLRDAAAMHR